MQDRSALLRGAVIGAVFVAMWACNLAETGLAAGGDCCPPDGGLDVDASPPADATAEADVETDAPAPFSPASLPNLEIWYRSDQGVVFDGGVLVGWRDYSGNNDVTRDAYIGNLSPPTLIDAGLTKAVYFGTTSGLRTSTLLKPLSEPLTIFVVAAKAAIANPPAPSYLLDSTNPNAQMSLVVGTDNILREYAGSFGPAATSAVTTPMSIIAVYNGASSFLLQNTVNLDAGAAANPGSTTTTAGFTVGNWAGATATSFAYGLGGSVSDVAVYSRVLTSAEIASLGSYAATRYGVVLQ